MASARRGMAIDTSDGGLGVGGVDVHSTLAVLARLGADGSDSLDHLSAEGTIVLLTGLRELSAAMGAVQARALIRLESAVKDDCLARGEKPRTAVKIARSEASFALHAAPAATGQSLSGSRRLVQSMPGMLRSLAQGRISPAAAHRVGRVVGPASLQLRSQVDEVLTEHLPYLEGCGVQEWGSEAEKAMHALDPAGAAARHTRATQERGVSVRGVENGMSLVTAKVPALDGARIRKSLSLAAEKARAAGDRRGHAQIMADQFTDTLLGRDASSGPSTLEIGVIITDRSLLSQAHADPAMIEGIGPVPYEHIREEMRLAMRDADDDPELRLALRNLYTDPEDGQLIAVESRSRRFPPALARFLRWTHLSCRAPYCDAAIRQSDHVVPRAQGGATSLDNGNGLCAMDNQKEEAGVHARVVHDDEGRRRTVEWATRYGQKAYRRGINHDPVGTAWRRIHQRGLAEDLPTESGSDAGGMDVSTAETAAGPPSGDLPPDAATMPRSGTARALIAEPEGAADSSSVLWTVLRVSEAMVRGEHEPAEPDSHAHTHRALRDLVPSTPHQLVPRGKGALGSAAAARRRRRRCHSAHSDDLIDLTHELSTHDQDTTGL